MTGSISNIDLSDDQYTVKQRAVRNSYKVYDSSDREVLSAKQKLFKMKEEFPFTNPEGKEVFSIKAENLMDIAGDYAIIDSKTDKKIAVLKKEFSIFIHKWKIEDSDGNLIASIESRVKLIGLLRGISDVFDLLPHKYKVSNSGGNEIGQIKQSFTLLRDKYKIDIQRDVEGRESIIAAAIAIDALEGN